MGYVKWMGSFFSLFHFSLFFIYFLWIYITSTCSLSLFPNFNYVHVLESFIIIVFFTHNWIIFSNILFFHIFLGISSTFFSINYLLLLPLYFPPLLPTKTHFDFFSFFYSSNALFNHPFHNCILSVTPLSLMRLSFVFSFGDLYPHDQRLLSLLVKYIYKKNIMTWWTLG